MNVLVVTPKQQVGDAVRATLLDAGHDVTVCRGPCGRSYVCAGGRDKACPFPAAADVVVLDCRLESDVLHVGTPSRHLVRYYRGLGLPVIALAEPDDLPVTEVDDGVVVVPRRSASVAVTEAVAAAA